MKMKSVARGRSTSAVEVTNISGNGFWLLIGESELFVSFESFPWFKQAAVGQILNVELPSEHHLYWPELDVDLAVDSIRHPDQFPLVSKVGSNKSLQRTTGAGQVRDKTRTPRRASRR
jgi:hypothetical protein